MTLHDVVVFVKDAPWFSQGDIGLVTYVTEEFKDLCCWVKISSSIEILANVSEVEKVGKL